MHSMKTDKGQFDAVLKRMLDTPPQKTSEIRAGKKAQAKHLHPVPFVERARFRFRPRACPVKIELSEL